MAGMSNPIVNISASQRFTCDQFAALFKSANRCDIYPNAVVTITDANPDLCQISEDLEAVFCRVVNDALLLIKKGLTRVRAGEIKYTIIDRDQISFSCTNAVLKLETKSLIQIRTTLAHLYRRMSLSRPEVATFTLPASQVLILPDVTESEVEEIFLKKGQKDPLTEFLSKRAVKPRGYDISFVVEGLFAQRAETADRNHDGLALYGDKEGIKFSIKKIPSAFERKDGTGKDAVKV